jgi:ATP-dependent Clp protease ATP-binding subunit ClpB
MLERTIRPEFLNRIDDIIVFSPLTRDDVKTIVGLQFERIMERMNQNGLSVRITDEAVNWIAAVGYDPAYGARPVKRLLQRHVLNELSKRILSGDVDQTSTIVVDIQNEELVFRNETNV